jgi:hypothetical protein
LFFPYPRRQLKFVSHRAHRPFLVISETTLPYSPYQNGKQEAFWGQLESRLLELLRGVDNLSLRFVNQAAQAWVEQDYHRNRHREICTSPLFSPTGSKPRRNHKKPIKES